MTWIKSPHPWLDVTHARRIVADADIRLREHDTQWCAGMAIVAKTALMRGATTAVYWLSPPVYDYKIVSSLFEAIRWGHSQLEKPTA